MPDWREFLSSSERVEVDALEANARILDERRKALSHELLMHRSRCFQRRRERMTRQPLSGRTA
jgi:hypothetical protein